MFGELGQQTGYSTEQMKVHLMRELGYVKYVEVMGETFEIREETHKMGVRKLSALIEDVYVWAAENGFPL